VEAQRDGVGGRFAVLCPHCDRAVRAQPGWAGQEAQCPHCRGVFRVPAELSEEHPVLGERPKAGPRYRFNFGCPRCGTLLEAHTGRCGEAGTCPTCDARLIVPGLDERTHMPLPAKLLNVDAQDPTPLHAYAASGEQAPRIQRLPDGRQVIICPRCGTQSEMDADSCERCGAPYTLEAAPAVGGARAPWDAESLVLGIVSLPLFFWFVPGILAIVMGALSLRGGMRRRGAIMPMIGVVLGAISVVGGLIWLVIG
jgi:hypothetical protein